MKSNRAAKKRFRVTSKGKVRCEHAGDSHYFTAKAPRRKRRLGKGTQIDPSDQRRVKRMILA